MTVTQSHILIRTKHPHASPAHARLVNLRQPQFGGRRINPTHSDAMLQGPSTRNVLQALGMAWIASRAEQMCVPSLDHVALGCTMLFSMARCPRVGHVTSHLKSPIFVHLRRRPAERLSLLIWPRRSNPCCNSRRDPKEPGPPGGVKSGARDGIQNPGCLR